MKRTAFLFILALTLALGTLSVVGAEGVYAEPAPGTQVHLPVLTYLGDEADACSPVVEVQNVGDDFTKAMLLFWEESSACPPDCAGPYRVGCSGLLAPGSTWTFLGRVGQVPSGASSGIAFSLSTEQQGGDIIADAVCEAAYGSIRGNCDEYRRFKKSFDEGNMWQGFDFGDDAKGEPLAVEVVRRCQTAEMDAPIVSAYSGVAGDMLGWAAAGQFGYHAPLVYGDAQGRNSYLYLQNAGLECTDVELQFTETQAPEQECPNGSTADEVLGLAPGETIQYDVSALVDAGFVGDARFQASEPLAIVVDTFSADELVTGAAVPADGPSAGQTAGDRTLYASLTYREDESWDTMVAVQNLSATDATTVTVEFLDAAGTVLETQTAEGVCPQSTVTFQRPVADNLPGYSVGWVQISSVQTNVAGQVELIRWDSPDRTVLLEALSYSALPATRVEGVTRAFLPEGGYNDLGGGWETGLTSEFALANFNRMPGTTRFRVDVYAHNQVQHSLHYTLAAGQVAYVNIHDQGLINPGFKGSVVIEAESTTQGSVAFGAVAVSRYASFLQPDPTDDAPGDQTAAVTAWAGTGTFAPVPSGECPTVVPAASGTTGTQVHLPILNWLGDEADACDVLIEVQNVGDDFAKAMVMFWGEAGSYCPPLCGPFKTECSGLLKPGASWSFAGPDDAGQIPAGAKGGIVFALSTEQVDSDVFADAVCETAFSSCGEYRRFKRAFSSGGTWHAFDFGTYPGQPLAVAVNRQCQTAYMDAPITSAYNGVVPADLQSPGSGCSFEYEVPLLYADWDGMSSYLYIQNAGLECTRVEIWLKAQGECIRSTVDEIPALAPGETYAYDVNTVVGPIWRGSAWVRMSQPAAIVVDSWNSSNDVLTTYHGEPAGLDDSQAYTTTQGSPVHYGPLIYRPDNGWDNNVQVFNLDPERPATVHTTFLDDAGAVIRSIADAVCPLGTQTYHLGLIDSLPGRAAGAVQVTVEGDSPPPITAVAELYDAPIRETLLKGLVYELSPTTQVESVERIALGSLYKDAQGSTGLLSEVVVTNWNTAPGSTSLALDLYDQNGLIDSLHKTIGPGQTLRISLEEESSVTVPWRGSGVLRATESTQAGGPSLNAVVVNAASTSFATDAPGDETQVHEGWPLDVESPAPSGTPGDANGDGTVDAGDISAVVLEIFDGDGNSPADAPGGTFAGDPVGCDANEDGLVDAGDISCTVLLIFNGPGACGAGTTGTSTTTRAADKRDGPVLRLGEPLPAPSSDTVTVPLDFTAGGHAISSLVFSLDYDAGRLAFDPTDSDGDGLPEAIAIDLPVGFNASVALDKGDPDGELDLFIADTFPPLGALPDGELVTIRLQVVGKPAGAAEAPVQFAQEPAASFGDTAGRRVPGVTAGGSVLIGPADR